MANPTHPDNPKQTPALPRHLAATVTVSTLAGLTVLAAALEAIVLPPPLAHAAVAAAFAPWVLYLQARSHRLMQQRMDAVAWADGFVHGVSRRTPPREKVRWLE